MSANKNFTENQIKEIIRLYVEEGLHQKEIGKKFDTSQAGIGYQLRKNKIVCRRPRNSKGKIRVEWKKSYSWTNETEHSITGVYLIRNKINQNTYIGSADDIHKRCMKHFHDLIRIKHDNSKLQLDFNNFGSDNFKIIIGEQCQSSKDALRQEYEWIITYYNTYRNILLNKHIPYNDKVYADFKVGNGLSKLLENVVYEGDCWIFTGSPPNSDGYGIVYHNGNKMLAHRCSYRLHNETMQCGSLIAHKCNRKMCINPKHLYEASHKQNGKDYSVSSKQGCLF